MANRVCATCGEEYSDTYRRCPFCEEEAAIKRGRNLRRGGKRSIKRRSHSGGAGSVMLLLAFVVILGVVGFVFFGDQVADFMGIRRENPGTSQGGDVQRPNGGSTPGGTDPAGTNPGGTDPSGGEVTPPNGDPPDGPPVEAGPLTLESPVEFTIPAGETGRITVSGGAGNIVWTSSNPEIASVDDGHVTGVAGGKVTITATAGEESVSCTVTVTGDPWVSSVSFSLCFADGRSATDFSFSNKYPGDIQLKVVGGEYSSISWSIDKTGVATVSSTGLVSRGSSKGTATITVVVDGQTLTCIVRNT